MKIDDSEKELGGLAAASSAITADQLAVLKQQARFCRTMGHPIRLFLLHYLHEAGGEVGSSELAEVAGLARPTLSQHLSKMTAAGLVETERRGKYVFVRIAREEIGQACQLVHRALQSHMREGAERYES